MDDDLQPHDSSGRERWRDEAPGGNESKPLDCNALLFVNNEDADRVLGLIENEEVPQQQSVDDQVVDAEIPMETESSLQSEQLEDSFDCIKDDLSEIEDNRAGEEGASSPDRIDPEEIKDLVAFINGDSYSGGERSRREDVNGKHIAFSTNIRNDYVAVATNSAGTSEAANTCLPSTDENLEVANTCPPSTNENLEAANTCLRSTNENLEAANTYLLSTNENLEAAITCLPSTNENLEAANNCLPSTNDLEAATTCLLSAENASAADTFQTNLSRRQKIEAQQEQKMKDLEEKLEKTTDRVSRRNIRNQINSLRTRMKEKNKKEKLTQILDELKEGVLSSRQEKEKLEVKKETLERCLMQVTQSSRLAPTGAPTCWEGRKKRMAQHCKETGNRPRKKDVKEQKRRWEELSKQCKETKDPKQRQKIREKINALGHRISEKEMMDDLNCQIDKYKEEADSLCQERKILEAEIAKRDIQFKSACQAIPALVITGIYQCVCHQTA